MVIDMKNILIVDDKKRIRDIFKLVLTLEGFNIFQAEDAIIGNDILKKEQINLVLLDLKMQNCGGEIFYEIARSFHKNIKIIISSVYSIDDQKRIIKDADDYYDKSQGVEILLSKVKNVFKREL